MRLAGPELITVGNGCTVDGATSTWEVELDRLALKKLYRQLFLVPGAYSVAFAKESRPPPPHPVARVYFVIL